MLLGENMFLLQGYLSNKTENNCKVYFSTKLLHQLKCHFLIVSIIYSTIRSQHMSEVCFEF